VEVIISGIRMCSSHTEVKIHDLQPDSKFFFKVIVQPQSHPSTIFRSYGVNEDTNSNCKFSIVNFQLFTPPAP